MRHRAFLIFPTAILVSLAALFSFVQFASAESIVWNSSENVQLCSDGDQADCVTRFSHPSVSIEYAADIANAAGEPIQCGGSVPVGTQIRLKPRRYSATDISWFTTGYTMDSPYGVWSSDLSEPKAALCREANYLFTSPYYGGAYNKIYGLLRVAPPDVHIDPGGLRCTEAEGGALDCVATDPGSFTPSLTYAATQGRFWADYYIYNFTLAGGGGSHCTSLNQLMTTYVGAYDGQWGAESIATYNNSPEYYFPNSYHGIFRGERTPYALQVPSQTISCPITVIAASGNNPPSTPTLTSTSQCVVGTAHSLSIVSTDPDDDGVRYAVDWDANGVVDQWVPPSGYVDSGVLQTASRTYAIPGSKTVKVLAQDENGNTSNWASISFSCAGSTTAGLNEGDTEAGSDTGSAGGLALLPDLDLRVIPSLVKSGNTTKVNWSSANVQSCTVSGENGDAWSALQSPLGGLTSQPITSETIYTLTCLDLGGGTLTKSATVRIIPTFQEK